MADNAQQGGYNNNSIGGKQSIITSGASNDIVRTFEALVRKSSRLFGSLRDLPQFGKFWSNHFQKTFEVYTKLWKYQQQHRNFLEDKEKYGLKRWEIGEIASKIGQLYYHYYLRTSDTNYLQESYIFYEALRSRAYFKDAMDSRIPDLMVKVMRYYARFIVVCLLLNRKRVVLELVEELTRHVDDYIKSLKPTDAQEWHLVLQEITTFLQADITVDAPQMIGIPSPRLDPSTLRTVMHTISPSTSPNISLQQAILVGNHSHQIKFSELTLEMFRMMLALEFDPDWKEGVDNERESTKNNEENGGGPVGGQNSKRRNPHKYLLYRPTSAQLLMFIATAMKELHDGRAMLIYISADGNSVTDNSGQRGLVMNTNRSPATNGGRSSNNNSNNNSILSSPDVMYPQDFFPFARRPLFLIIDSDASVIFKDIPNTFQQPVVCLMSPTAAPSSLASSSGFPRAHQRGNVFTLFLSDPLSAFYVVHGIDKLKQSVLEESVRCLQTISETICKIVYASAADLSFISFMGDDFMRSFIVRYVFCYVTLRQHKAYCASASYLPTSKPELPQEVLQHADILTAVAKLADVVGVSDQRNK
jgi:hypothetical protein